MKKKLFLLLSAVLVLALLTALVVRLRRPSLVILEPECLLEVPYDPEAFYSSGILVGSKITWWDQFHSKEDLAKAFSTYGVDVSVEESEALAIDLEQNSYILSFGREIAEIRYWDKIDRTFYSYSAEVTFAEAYDGNVLYVYRGPRHSFLPFESYKEIYIMQGDQRVYWGLLSEINMSMSTEGPGL